MVVPIKPPDNQTTRVLTVSARYWQRGIWQYSFAAPGHASDKPPGTYLIDVIVSAKLLWKPIHEHIMSITRK